MYSTDTLYILIFLHQTATSMPVGYAAPGCISLYSYIKPQQETEYNFEGHRCISLYSYIKPQPYFSCSRKWCAVYPYIPTSNRNRIRFYVVEHSLYILIFLHQTATVIGLIVLLQRCISLYSYIKPQPKRTNPWHASSCISLYSYIKPQQR